MAAPFFFIFRVTHKYTRQEEIVSLPGRVYVEAKEEACILAAERMGCKAEDCVAGLQKQQPSF